MQSLIIMKNLCKLNTSLCILQTIDLANLNLTVIQADFVEEFNMTEYSRALMRPILTDLQNMEFFENITAKVNSTLDSLEKGDSIFKELRDELSYLINVCTYLWMFHIYSGPSLLLNITLLCAIIYTSDSGGLDTISVMPV